MTESETIRVSQIIKTTLKIKSAKEGITMFNIANRILREKLIEEGDLIESE